MNFPDPYVRVRARRVPDPYNPDSTVPDWDSPDRDDQMGWFDSAVSTNQVDPVRSEAITTVSLYVPSDADLRRGDRVEADGDIYQVTGIPRAPANPFTGWSPVRVAALKLVEG